MALFNPIVPNPSVGVVHCDASGNLTSSALVNADVSSAAALAVSKLSAGLAGQVLLNDGTPTPVWTSLSGDVTVSSSGATTIGAVSGASPVPITPATLQWGSSISSPMLAQADFSSAGATGQTLNIRGQSNTAGSGTGASVGVQVGTGATANGSFRIGTPSADAIRFGVSPAGSSNMTVQSAVTGFSIVQASTSAGAGASWTIAAQSTTLDGSNGGALTLRGGDATTGNGGSLALRTGAGAGNNFITIGQGSAVSITLTMTPSAGGAASWSWAATHTSVLYTQAANSSGNGATTTISAQSTTNTGTTNTGGKLVVQAGNATGAGTTNNGADLDLVSGDASNATANNPGKVNVKQGSTTLLTWGGSGEQFASTSVAITGGTTTLTAAQYRFGYIKLTGTLTSNATVVFPNTSGGRWVVDATGVTLGGFTITLQTNSNSWGTTVGTSALYVVQGNGTRLYGTSWSS